MNSKRFLNELTGKSPEKAQTVLDLFQKQVNSYPEKKAIREASHSYTYTELDELATKISQFLGDPAFQFQQLVPVSMDRTHRYVATILGIIKSGKAFVPLNPEWPEQRKREILQQLNATFLFSEGETSDPSEKFTLLAFDEAVRVGESTTSAGLDRINPDTPAYILYTSGSTGSPKGVQVNHRQLFAATQNRIDRYPGVPHLLLIPPLSFDASLAAIFWPLCTGGSLVMSSAESIREPEAIPSLLAGTNTLLCVPSYYRFLLEEGLLKGQQLERVILGGESLPKTLALAHFQEMNQVRLYNEYGPTETTIWSTVAEITPKQDPITIGTPLAGVSCYVLDPKTGARLPAGIGGELYIGGIQVAQGYWKDPALTAARFLPDPFSEEKGAILYATGDRVRSLPDGRLVFEGRNDRQVKFQGNRIDLAEIEKVLLDSEKVSEAVAMLAEPLGSNPQLLLFIVPKGRLNAGEARHLLEKRLPGYMIPGKIELRDRFPRTENGKLDQQALLAGLPEETKMNGLSDKELHYLVQAVGDVLGVEQPDVSKNIFELGGNSLAAMQLVARLNNEHKVGLRVSDIFDHPTISELHGVVRRRRQAEVVKSGASAAPSRAQPLPPAVSSAQQSLWIVDQLEGSLAYHLSVSYLLTGKLDPNRLEVAIRAVIKKHKSLRTCILGIDRVRLKAAAHWKFDLYRESEREFSESVVREDFDDFFRKPFDLREDFMVRGRLLSFGKERHVLGLVFHHIAFDDHSMKIFLRELSDNYRSLATGAVLEDSPDFVEPPPATVHDQREVPEDTGSMAYWEKTLAGWEILQLPTDYSQTSAGPRPAGILRFFLDRQEIAPVAAIGKEHQATLFMTFLALFKVLLYRYTNQVDICVGTTVADRNFPGAEEQIGYLITTVPLRSRIQPADTFDQFLHAIKKEVREALAHARIPFLKLVEAFSSGDTGGKPFFNTLFVMHEGAADAANLQLPDIEVGSLDVDPFAAKFDLSFSLAGDATGLQGSIEYDAGKFAPETIERLLAHFRQLMQTLPEQLHSPVKKMTFLSADELDALSGEEASQADTVYRSFFDRFEEQVARKGPETALLTGRERMDFSSLDRRATKLADWLVREGVRQGDHVVLLAARGSDMVAAMLGIWKAGAAYVPVDPAYPAERIAFIVADCGASHLLVDEASAGLIEPKHGGKLLRLQQGLKESDFEPQRLPNLSPDQRAYLIYTSGTTGKPKGVCLTQANLAAFLDWCGREFAPESFALMYAATSMCFDLSIFELFFPLAFGKPIRILQNGLQIPEYLPGDQGVLINTVPSLVQKLLEEKVDLAHVALLNMAGELLPGSLVNQLDLESLPVRNLYGPTEDTTYSTCERLLPGKPVSIGRPIAGSFAYVLNADLMPCPVGVPGEIYLGGRGLAQGYWNRPGLTAEKFVPNPLVKAAGSILYKTGDRGVWRSDGKIDFLGRLDNQIKLNGYRIELDEIATLMQAIPGVKNAVVVLQQAASGEKRLAGFFTADQPLDTRKIQGKLRDALPGYMLPSQVVQVDRFPLTPNGKIDRKQLEKAAILASEQKGFAPPTTLLESNLLDLWRTVLRSDQAGVRDNFFLLGGNSLLALRLLGKIRESIGVEISVTELFSHPTVSAIADLIRSREQTSTVSARILPCRPRPDRVPLSFGQESLWLTDKLEGSSQYHIPLLIKITGETRRMVLQEAIKSIMERHEVLRTVIRERGDEASQQVMPVAAWELAEASGHLGASQAGLPDREMAEFLARPFDLGKDYMIRAKKYPLDGDACHLFVVVHHIAFDGWSISVFLSELFALVKSEKRGENPLLPHLKIQYADYALWQRNRLRDETLAAKMQYWKEKLAGLRPFHFYGEGVRAHRKSHDGATYDIRIGSDLRKRILELAKQLGLSPFMLLLAAFKSLLERNSGQRDLCVGTAMGGRNHTETEPMIGYFVNPLPIRSKLNPSDSFRDTLLAVKKNTLEAYEHQEVPFEKIVAATAQHRQFGVNPLFQVMFVMEYGDEVRNSAEGLSMEVQSVPQTTAKFDLTFLVKESSTGIGVRIEYSKDIFDAERIEKLASQYIQLLDSGLADPNQKISQLVPDRAFSGLGKVEAYEGINQRYLPIQRMIEAAASRNGDRTAVFFGRAELSYASLNSQANQLAAYLLDQGLKKGEVVGILLPRSPAFVIGILGILKAGGAYLPLDTDLPAQRIGYMLEDSCSFFITGADEHQIETSVTKILWEEFQDRAGEYPTRNTEVHSVPDDPAYLIYTSGTTGKPKGVALDHLNLFHFVSVVNDQPGISATDRVLAVSSVSFDIALLETLVSLVFGAQIIILDREQRKEPRVILEELENRAITVMFATPSHWKMMLEGGWTRKVESLRIISGGEPLEMNLVQRLLPLGAELWNVYGPTETTVYATIKQVRATDREITVGKPAVNTRLYVVDKDGNPVQKGRKGEIWVAGHGVGSGYLNQPELTRERFIEIPAEAGSRHRVYKTGDLGWITPADELVVSGRMDHQVKIRGHRIELAEVESGLRQLKGIKDAIVLVRKDANEQAFLRAYLVPTQEAILEAQVWQYPEANQVRQWRNQLAENLAEVMIPTDYLWVKAFSLTENGKVNREALPDPERGSAASTGDGAGFDPEERLVAEIWKKALGLEQIRKTDNFFEIGGHSLTAVKVMVQLENVYGIRLPLSVLFKYPTIQNLSQAIKSGVLGDSEWKSLVAIKNAGSKPPLYIVHGGGLNILPFYAVAREMDREQPVFGIQAKGLDGVEQPLQTVEAIASQYLSEVLQQNPNGPYFLAGYSLGGIIAYEMACQLRKMGKSVEKLVLFDTYAFQRNYHLALGMRLLKNMEYFFGKRKFDVELLLRHPDIFKRIKKASWQRKFRKVHKLLGAEQEKAESSLLKTYKRVEYVYKEACKGYEIPYYDGAVDLIKARIASGYLPDKEGFGWKPFVNELRVWEAEGEHITMLSPPNDASFARLLQQVLDQGNKK